MAAGRRTRPAWPGVDTTITAELVADLVADQFPQWAELPVRPVELDGWDNHTFRLGEDMAVRLPSAEPYVPQVDKEDRWLPVLRPRLPFPIPEPLARGEPSALFPWPWSVRRWLRGQPAVDLPPDDLSALAESLAGFLVSLERIDARDGPPAGAHSFSRGAHPSVYDAETRSAIATLGGAIDGHHASRLWAAALGDGVGPPARLGAR